ncbi:methyl-accepting chemotaxis protein [Deinococcus sp. VB142]|uniref:Methyl-accepting chemotaxis protein n=1 Tax=Deinococcus sp. VB142 TaxID=3112952 RepID=A0AAU6Q5W0_9DEIO
MRGTLAGIRVIREGTQDVATSMTTLTEHSRQIQNVVDTITQISSQINLLSLHASIEAAGAGAAGSRFSVVADEVRQLADQANEATGRVTLLLASVQRDIEQTMKSVQHNAEQVEQGYLIAGEAERRLQELAQLAQHSAQLAGHISQESGAQAQEVTQIGQGVQHIAATAQQAQQSVQRGRQAADRLQALAQELGSALSRFRLPG